MKKRINIREDLKPPSKEHYEKRFKEDVIDNYSFNEHLKETALLLDIHPDIVKDVIIFYLKSICDILMLISLNENTTISVYGWFKIVVIKHTDNFKRRKNKNLRK